MLIYVKTQSGKRITLEIDNSVAPGINGSGSVKGIDGEGETPSDQEGASSVKEGTPSDKEERAPTDKEEGAPSDKEEGAPSDKEEETPSDKPGSNSDGKSSDVNRKLAVDIQKKFTLHPVMRPRGSIRIYVHCVLTRKRFQLEVEATDTIKLVKAKIEFQQLIPPHDQRLVFLGRELENDRTVDDYSIQNESTIDLVLIMKGS